MPREAKLFASSSGSVVRGYLKFRANITPRWIRNARTSRKRVEPEIVRSLRMLGDLKKNRPRARSTIEHAGKALRAVLNRWEMPTARRILSRHTYSFGAAAEWCFESIDGLRQPVCSGSPLPPWLATGTPKWLGSITKPPNILTRAFAPTHISWTGLTSQCRSNFIPRWSGCVCPAKYAQPESPLCLRSPKAFPLTQWRYPMLLLVQLRGGGIAGGRKYFKILRNKSPRLDHFLPRSIRDG